MILNLRRDIRDQWNRIENPIFFTNMPKPLSRWNNILFNKWCWENWISTLKGMSNYGLNGDVPFHIHVET
jgi:hypothetical protein